jgi:hypothetical protein
MVKVQAGMDQICTQSIYKPLDSKRPILVLRQTSKLNITALQDPTKIFTRKELIPIFLLLFSFFEVGGSLNLIPTHILLILERDVQQHSNS